MAVFSVVAAERVVGLRLAQAGAAGHIAEAFRALAVEVDDARGGREKRLDANHIVARIGDDLGIARHFRAPVGDIEMRPIGGAIEGRPVGRTLEAVFGEHAVPAVAVIGRLDQRIGQIPQPPLVVGQTKFGGPAADAGDGFAPDPGMHIVGHQLGPHPAEIAVEGAAPEQRRASQGGDRPKMSPRRSLSARRRVLGRKSIAAARIGDPFRCARRAGGGGARWARIGSGS